MNQLFVIKKESTIVDLYVEATVVGKMVYQEHTPCRFYYEAGYMQQVVEIDWCITDTVMNNIGLHSRYNTNFQDFEFDGNMLTIKSDEFSIYIRRQK